MTSITRSGQVKFRFFRPGVESVSVVGDFTAWQSNPLAMKPEGDGWWTLRLSLGAGEYRFRYLADGAWYTDFASHGVELTRNHWNSVLVVAEDPIRAEERIPVPVRLAA